MSAYPPTRRGEETDDYHGTTIPDPYRWLEDADAAETRAWIAAQNALTESWLSRIETRDASRERLTQLWDHPRAGAPFHRAGRWFGLRNSGLQNQDVLYVGRSPADDGEVLLDPNELSEDGTVSLSALAVSDDGRLLAYAVSDAGSDWLTWHVLDVDAGTPLGDEVRWSKFSSAAWLPDNSGFLYGAYDEPASGEEFAQRNLNQRLRLHRLGSDPTSDPVVYQRPDEPEWGFDPHITHDGRWLVVDVWHGTDPRNRVYLAPITGGAPGAVRPLLDAFDAGYWLVGSDQDTLYFRTDNGAPRGRVIAVDIDRPEPEHWREVVAEGDDTLERVRLVGGHLVCVYLHHAHHEVRLFDVDGNPAGTVELPGIGSVDALTGREPDDGFCFTFTSFSAPAATYRHDLGSGETRQLRPPGLSPTVEIETEQVFVPSRDGTQIPLFLVRRADVTPNGERPVWLYGYGGFEIALTPTFKVEWLTWLERGGVLAVANLRGGGEYGRAWHDAGRLANKQNVFDDCIACAEWLIEAGWTTAGHLGLHGRSNGGLLVGACMTQRPDLFGACVPEVGVLDMLRFHTFTIGWGWASDYGTADDPEQFHTLLAYSPLHNIVPGTSYPATLITTGDHDDRVVPAHSFKFAAALQAAQAPDGPPVLIRIETDAGHGAGKPTSKLIAERADVVAFLAYTLGLDG